MAVENCESSSNRPRHYPWYFYAGWAVMTVCVSQLPGHPLSMRIFFWLFATWHAGFALYVIWQDRVKFSLRQILLVMSGCAALATLSRYFEDPLSIALPIALGSSLAFVMFYSAFLIWLRWKST
jgi:hypothetical protein